MIVWSSLMLLAHELEHLIEQLERTDLAALARTGAAHRGRDGAFETRRAISAGRRVAGEVLNNAPDRIRGAPKVLWRGFRRLVGASACSSKSSVQVSSPRE